MRKLLLTGALLTGSIFAANAQYTNSFESAEGFSAGTVYEQNEWLVSTTEAGDAVANFNITTAAAIDGTQSLSLGFDELFAPSTTGVNFAAISNAFTGFDQTVATVRIKIEVDEDEETDAANYAIQFEDATNATSRIEFDFSGAIAVIDMVGDAPDYVLVEDVEWTPNVWMRVDMIYDFGAGTINYYLDGTLIFEGTVWAGEGVERLILLTDNWPGSIAYVDGVEVYEGTVAGVNENAITSLSVFPNPASDVVNIANSDNALVNAVTVTDLNGRTVKSAKFNGVSTAEVNVSDLASGVYMVTISSDKGTTTKKIVKN